MIKMRINFQYNENQSSLKRESRLIKTRTKFHHIDINSGLLNEDECEKRIKAVKITIKKCASNARLSSENQDLLKRESN